MWQSSQGLMDEAVEPDLFKAIQNTLDSFNQKTIRFNRVMTRHSGQRRFVDLHMHMPPHWTLGRGAEVRCCVEQALMDAVPDATIQLLPSDVETHFNFPQDMANSVFCSEGKTCFPHRLPLCSVLMSYQGNHGLDACLDHGHEGFKR